MALKSTSVIIDPVRRQIRYEQCDLSDMRRYCPSGITAAGTLDRAGHILYVDDEGMLRAPTNGGFRLDGARPDTQPFIGYGIIQGPDVYDGKGNFLRVKNASLSPTLLAWCSPKEIEDWFRRHREEACITINGEVVSTVGDVAREWLK